MDSFQIVADGRRLKMMAVLDGCRVSTKGKAKGNHPRRIKPIGCSELGSGNHGFREYRMCRRKDRYRSQGEANAKIGIIRNVRPEENLRAYYCPYCEGWHLTNDNKKGK